MTDKPKALTLADECEAVAEMVIVPPPANSALKRAAALIRSQQAEIERLSQGEGWVLVPREPTEAMRKAAFGPILHGGRTGPITADFLRQEAALSVYRAMISARPEGEGAL